MPLTNAQLKYYDTNIVRLPDNKRKAYHKQGVRPGFVADIRIRLPNDSPRSL